MRDRVTSHEPRATGHEPTSPRVPRATGSSYGKAMLLELCVWEATAGAVVADRAMRLAGDDDLLGVCELSRADLRRLCGRVLPELLSQTRRGMRPARVPD